VSYGVAGMRDAGSGMRKATLAVTVDGRRLLSRVVPCRIAPYLHETHASRIPHPASRLDALEVRLDGVSDSEPRDDARLFVLEVSPQPSVVLLASPPDWETRFLRVRSRTWPAYRYGRSSKRSPAETAGAIGDT